jgi:hypothetical protein
MGHWWNDTDRGKPRHSEINLILYHCAITIAALTDIELNLGLSDEIIYFHIFLNIQRRSKNVITINQEYVYEYS